MKKYFLFISAAIILFVSSCGKKITTTAKLESNLDTINYVFGFLNGENFKYMFSPEDTTSANLQAMATGFGDGFKSIPESEIELSEATTSGIQFNNMLKDGFLMGDSALKVNRDIIYSTVDSILSGATSVRGFDATNSNQFVFKIFQQLRDTTRHNLSTATLDSLNTAFAVMQSGRITQMVNDTNRTEFSRKFKEGLKMEGKEKFRALGFSMAATGFPVISKNGLMNDSTLVLNRDIFVAGINAGVLNDTTMFNAVSARNWFQNLQMKLHSEKMASEFGDWKAENEQWLEKNKSNPHVKVTDSGLQYEVIREGKGDKPAATDQVKVHYEGKLINDSVFDSSYKRKEHAVFALNQVIPGWTEGIQLMNVGAKYRFYIPQNLAYADQQAGSILPFSTLVFDVELIGIEPQAKVQAKDLFKK